MNDTLTFMLITCLGVAVQSFAGFAGALTAVPLFALFLSPKDAIPAYNLVLLVIDIFLLFEARAHVQWSRVKVLLAGGAVGIPFGALGLKHLPLDAIGVVISVVTGTCALLLLANVRIRLKDGLGTQLGVGLLSGLLSGCVAQPGPPVIVYSLARGWEKDIFRATLLTYFTCLCGLAVFTYWQIGLVTRGSVLAAGVTIPPAVLIARGGMVLKNRASEASFRRAILITVMLVSLVNAAKYIWPH